MRIWRETQALKERLSSATNRRSLEGLQRTATHTVHMSAVVHSNEQESVEFALLRNSTRGLTPREGTLCTPEKSGHFTVGSNRFGVREPNLAEFGLVVLEKRFYEYTHRQLSFVYTSPPPRSPHGH